MTVDKNTVPLYRCILGGVFAACILAILGWIQYTEAQICLTMGWALWPLSIFGLALVAELVMLIAFIRDPLMTLDKFAVGFCVAMIFALIALVVFSMVVFSFHYALVIWAVIIAVAVFAMKIRTELFWRKKNQAAGYTGNPVVNYSMGLNWYKVVLWGVLPVFALLNLINGLGFLVIMGNAAMGIINLAIVALAAVAWFALEKLCSNAPMIYYSVFVANAVMAAARYIDVLISVPSAWLSVVISLIIVIAATALYLWPNIVYFKKREDLFDN